MSENDKQTEEKIFEAATDVFVDKGMDGSRMQDIANRAGINKALLHYYFRTKDQLFNAVFEMIARKIPQKICPCIRMKILVLRRKSGSSSKKHIKFLQENPKLPAFILNEVNRKPAQGKKYPEKYRIR